MEEGECFSCDKCNFQTTTQGQLEKHQINRHVTFSCDLCHFEAAKKRDIRDHLRFKHYGLTYNCELCAKKFNGKMFLKRHMFKMHGSQLSSRACCREVKIPNQPGGVILWSLFMYRFDP